MNLSRSEHLELTILFRKSVRTFDGNPLPAHLIQQLKDYAQKITNPYGNPVEFVFLDARQHDLSSPVIRGEHLYVAGKIKKQKHCEEAFGYSFEQFVLYAWSLGIGTTWIGGTMHRESFENAWDLQAGEIMPIVTPLGYPSKTRSEVDQRLRENVRGDERLPFQQLFFDTDFSRPLTDDPFLECVRWAPSAVNLQPWRVVKDGSSYHLYEKHGKGFTAQAQWDVQKIDVGIALCHLMNVSGGDLVIRDPGIPVPDDTEYIATVEV